jgi:hypothetical protein
MNSPLTVQRRHAEDEFAEELTALAAVDDRPRPPRWRLSPWAVRTYLLGGTLKDGRVITPKYIGGARLIEIAIATLATDRALLLLGVPGTAKSWVSEHLAAAISGDSTLLVQGTAGTDEAQLRYGWNYARLLAEGPSPEGAGVLAGAARHARRQAGARRGADAHVERRAGHADHDALREDAADPRAGHRGAGRAGLQRHRHGQQPRPGVNDLSSALVRRFNTVVLPLPASRSTRRCPSWTSASAQLGRALALPAEPPALEEIRRVVTIFRELRGGVTLKTAAPSSSRPRHAVHRRGDLGHQQRPGHGGALRRRRAARAPIWPPASRRGGEATRCTIGVVWLEYLKTVAKDRDGWKDLYRACLEVA